MARASDLQILKEAFQRVESSGLDVFRLRGARSYDDLRTGLVINGQQYEWKSSGRVVYGPQRATNGRGEFVYMAPLFHLRSLNGCEYAIANMLTGGKVTAYKVSELNTGFFIESCDWQRKGEVLA